MQPFYNSPDFLRPIRDNNRNEYILVQFHRVLKNTNMSILKNAFDATLKDHDLLELFPNLANYAKMNIDDQYTNTVLFNYPWELVFNLSEEKLSHEMCQQFAKQFQEPYDFSKLHETRMEGVLRNLLSHDFVKEIYIFADNFTKEMKDYIFKLFGSKGLGKRVIPINGTFQECLLALPQITTIFMSNASDFFELHQFYPEEVNQRFFIISDGYDNFQQTKDGKSFEYRGLSLFKTLDHERKCTVAYSYPYCIPKL